MFGSLMAKEREIREEQYYYTRVWKKQTAGTFVVHENRGFLVPLYTIEESVTPFCDHCRWTGSKTLDDMLLMQKPFGDKSGLGYLGESPPKQNGGEVNEIKPKKVISKPLAIPIVCNNVKKVQDVNKTSNEKVIPTCHYCHIKSHIRPHCKKLHMAHTSHTHVGLSHCLDKFVPTCHFCGMKGHIRPNCFELHGFSIVPPQYHVNNYRGRYYCSDNGFNRPRHRVSPHGKKMNVNPKHVPKKVGKTEKVKIRPIWVPRSNLRPYTNLSINNLDDTGPSGEVDLTF